MVHYKTIVKQRTSSTKSHCKFCLVTKGSKVIHGVYDRKSDMFYVMGKDGMPVMKRPYSTPKHLAVAHGCRPTTFAHKIFINGRSLRQLAIEARSPAEQLMQNFIPSPALQPPAPVPLDDWTTVTALRLQILQIELENSEDRADASSQRLARASHLLEQCKMRAASAEDELIIAKAALAEAQSEHDTALRIDDWEQDAVELNRDQLQQERGRVDIERFEREREANAP